MFSLSSHSDPSALLTLTSPAISVRTESRGRLRVADGGKKRLSTVSSDRKLERMVRRLAAIEHRDRILYAPAAPAASHRRVHRVRTHVAMLSSLGGLPRGLRLLRLTLSEWVESSDHRPNTMTRLTESLITRRRSIALHQRRVHSPESRERLLSQAQGRLEETCAVKPNRTRRSCNPHHRHIPPPPLY